MTRSFADLKRDYLFPIFIYSTRLSVDLEDVRRDCLEYRRNCPGVQKSNLGGWQSPTLEEPLEEYSALRDVIDGCRQFYEDVIVPEENLATRHSSIAWWANINKYNSSNAIHSHGGSLVTAVYYTDLPDPNAVLTLVRTDAHNAIYPPQQLVHQVVPEEGRLYLFPGHILHSVEPNLSERDRISVVTNLY